jgi:hypothetical protein
MNRLFAIADIHGRLDLLKKLWNDLLTNHALDLTSDKVIFTGDYVDRGPESYGVVAFLKDLQETHPNNVICLAGNHEWIAIMYYARGKNASDTDLWFRNGGIQTIESYQYMGYSDMINDHVVWLSKLPLKHEERNYFISHAPAPAEWARNILDRGQPEFSPDELMWTYHSDEKGVARNHGNGIIGVSGHIHQLRKGIMAPRFYDHHYYLDSGCGCSPKAPLCAVNLDTKEVIYAWP